MAKAARCISVERQGRESPMVSCQNCPTAGSMAAEPCTQQELPKLPRKCPLGAIQIAQYNFLKIMGLDILGLAAESQRAFCEFLSMPWPPDSF